MTFKEDVIAFGVLAVAVVGFAWWAKNKIADAIPETVKEGAQATGQIVGLAADAILHPLETFGVTPGASGSWEKTSPAENSNDPTSNNDYGINFNLF